MVNSLDDKREDDKLIFAPVLRKRIVFSVASRRHCFQEHIQSF